MKCKSVVKNSLIHTIKNYYELTKPNVWWLLVFTSIGAMIRAGGIGNEFHIANEIILLVILSVTFGTAGAESISNYIDRDIDAIMNRTKNRPIPTGRIKAKKALLFGIILSSGAIIFSFLIDYINEFNFFPIITFLMIFGLFDYIIIYSSILKRKTLLNIILGGFSGAVPALIGYTAVSKTLTVEGLLIATLVFLWIPAHIWSLSLKFKDDYTLAKIPMLPVVMDLKTSIRLIALSSILLVVFSLLLYNIGTIYFVTAIISGIIVLVTSIQLVLNPTTQRAWKLFKITSPYLAIIFLAMIIESFIKL